jgi:hypothetical protein
VSLHLLPRAVRPYTSCLTWLHRTYLAPRASHASRLVQRTPARALITPSAPRAAPPLAPASTFIVWQQVDEHVLQSYVSCVSNVCCICFIWMLQKYIWCCICCSGYTRVITTVCFSCFKRMLQVFHLDVVYVAVAIRICCKCVFQMFQLFHLVVACFHLDVAYVAVAIHVCCKCMFQMFHLFQTYVASVLSRCCYML